MSYFPYFIGAICNVFFSENLIKKQQCIILHIQLCIAVCSNGSHSLFLNGFFANVVNLAYIGEYLHIFAYKAYNGEEVKVEILDTIEEKISEKVKK